MARASMVIDPDATSEASAAMSVAAAASTAASQAASTAASEANSVAAGASAANASLASSAASIAVVADKLNDSAILTAPAVGDYKIYEIQRDVNGNLNIIYDDVARTV